MRTLALSFSFFAVVAVTGQTPMPLPELTCPEVATALRGVVSADGRLRDWALLNRYRAANVAVRNPDVAMIGDSITDSCQ